MNTVANTSITPRDPFKIKLSGYEARLAKDRHVMTSPDVTANRCHVATWRAGSHRRYLTSRAGGKKVTEQLRLFRRTYRGGGSCLHAAALQEPNPAREQPAARCRAEPHFRAVDELHRWHCRRLNHAVRSKHLVRLPADAFQNKTLKKNCASLFAVLFFFFFLQILLSSLVLVKSKLQNWNAKNTVITF